jgi:hypothetical protein
MTERSNTSRYQPGDLISVEIGGLWLDAEYVGYIANVGHMVQTDTNAELIPEDDRIRRRGISL